MNKYEEALEYVSNVLDESGSGWGDWDMYGLSEDPIKTFKELVDRETPMKPTHKEVANLAQDGFIPLVTGHCDNCGWEDLTELNNYCSNCGQRII